MKKKHLKLPTEGYKTPKGFFDKFRTVHPTETRRVNITLVNTPTGTQMYVDEDQTKH